MKIKITSDGTIAGTKVSNVETGEQLENVSAINWTGDAASGQVVAHLNVVAVPVELVAKLVVQEALQGEKHE